MPLYFGLGDAAKIDAVEVTWPSGRKQTVAGPKVNGQIQVVEEQAARSRPSSPRPSSPVPSPLPHREKREKLAECRRFVLSPLSR